LGRDLLGDIFKHSKDRGGIMLECLGMPGSAKTAFILSGLCYVLEHWHEDLCFFSEVVGAPIQSFKIQQKPYNQKVHLMVQEGSGIIFRNRETGEIVDLHPTYFKDYEDCYQKAKKEFCNTVFFKKFKTEKLVNCNIDRIYWTDFIAHLNTKIGWTWVFIDEMSDLCPYGAPNPIWQSNANFGKICHDLRKCNTSLWYNTQYKSDIDPRVRSKLQARVFMPGTVVDSNTRVYQSLIDNLEEDEKEGNQCVISIAGKFGKIRVTDVFNPVGGFYYDSLYKEG